MKPNIIEWERYLDPAKRLFSVQASPVMLAELLLDVRTRGIYTFALRAWHAGARYRLRKAHSRPPA